MAIRYLILALTTRCNLACAYCYNGGIKEQTDMSEAVLLNAMNLVGKDEGPLHLQLTGGEPTLVPALIEKAVRWARSLTRPCTIGIQTNGTRLNPDLVKFFKTFDVQIGVSLDGPPAIHEALRGQASQTFRGLQLLEVHKVPFRVTTVISRNNVGHQDKLVWTLAGFGQTRGIGLDLMVRRGRAGHGSALLPSDASALRSGLHAMHGALKAVNSRRRRPLQLRELELLKEPAPARGEERSFCHACLGHSLAVHPDGRLFPCGQTLGDARFAMGSVWRPKEDPLTPLRSMLLQSEECQTCSLKDRCPGECPSRLYYNQGDGVKLACELYRALWEAESRDM